MAHDVFVSYPSEDKPAADAACFALESKGIRCWIAPRDISPGADWAGSIFDAINGSQMMVLVFSDHANHSKHVRIEVGRAVDCGIPIIPMRIQKASPFNSLGYFLSQVHWLDAFPPPLDPYLERLAHLAQDILKNSHGGEQAPPPPAIASRVAITIKWPNAWSYFVPRDEQIIRWEALPAAGAEIDQFTVELYAGNMIVAALESNQKGLWGITSRMTWTVPKNLPGAKNYRIRVAAWEKQICLGSAFSKSFVIRPVGSNDVELLAFIISLFPSILSLELLKYVCWDLMLHEAPAYRVFFSILGLVCACQIAIFVAGIVGMTVASYRPARYILPVAFVVGGLIGQMVPGPRETILAGCVLGTVIPAYAIDTLFRGNIATKEVTALNKRLKDWAGGIVKAVWKKFF